MDITTYDRKRFYLIYLPPSRNCIAKIVRFYEGVTPGQA